MSFVNPAALSAPLDEAPSPTPSSSSTYDDRRTPAPSGPPRKRARSDITPEERREARAHRNRIAAQNSRDRRKVQFSTLQVRVNELEEENRFLRQELSKFTTPAQTVQNTTSDTRERENEELRERVRSLEKSWESVVRLLAAQSQPVPSVIAPSSSSPQSTAPSLSPIFSSVSPSPSSITLLSNDATAEESTRHLAAGGSTSPSEDRKPLPALDIPSAPLPSSVEDWFMDLISTSPTETTFTSTVPTAPSPEVATTPVPPEAPVTTLFDWECAAAEAEMQKLLAMLPAPEEAREELAGLGLDLGGQWSWSAVGA